MLAARYKKISGTAAELPRWNHYISDPPQTISPSSPLPSCRPKSTRSQPRAGPLMSERKQSRAGLFYTTYPTLVCHELVFVVCGLLRLQFENA